jgi:hypothetical protein
MGNGSYSLSDRSIRSFSKGYESKSRDEIFTQNREHKAHKDMIPSGIVFRECADSETHPNTIPIMLFLDVTGSMGHIPHEMIKDGLPTLMGTLIQNGVPDASLMFGAIGDHETDRYPLQIAQFESGDAELDMWLERTYLEGGGGGNKGESYLLAWYFAANHVRTDAYDKRKKKGFVFTIGDEPCLKTLPKSSIKEIMGDTAEAQSSFSSADLLRLAEEKNHVHHIFIEHGSRSCDNDWREMLGKNLHVIEDHKQVSSLISKIILETNSKISTTSSTLISDPVNVAVEEPATTDWTTPIL